MSDYIDILLTALEDELFPSLGKDYFLSLQQANDALTALSATLTDQQRALLDSYAVSYTHLVVNDGAASEKALTDALTEKFRCRVENGGEGRFRLAEAERNIRRQFGEEAFDRLPRTNPAAAMALGGLLHYLYETQKTDLSHINDLDYYEQGRFMELDLTARRNLELTETLRDREKRGSLLWVLEMCIRDRRTYIIKDVRLFLNSVDRGLRLIRDAGVDARTEREETEDEIVLTLRIPKQRRKEA